MRTPAELPDHMATLLIVEDNAETCLLLERLLTSSFDVGIARTPQEALDQIDDLGPDLVLMDIDLNATQDGSDLLHTLRAEGHIEASTPVVALTAYALPGDRERFLDDGFDAYVSKPFTREMLFTEIEALLP